mmetsp:Transcript_68244/g.134144  ORF Transcript_68244/g.134144 Transcript_68244/m.134144 type:complete len:134 (+) Transcript_68244:2-403(+)
MMSNMMGNGCCGGGCGCGGCGCCGGFGKKGGGGGSGKLAPVKGVGKVGAGKMGKAMGPMVSGEIRYENPMHAMLAVMSLNGTPFKGTTIMCGFDELSGDQSKIWISGLPAGTNKQELRNHFANCGPVAFAALK